MSKNNNKKSNVKNKIIKPFNKVFSNKLLKNNSNDLKKYKKEIEEYQKSFDSIIDFSKGFTAAKKKGINCILFHTENSDGVMSAYIGVKYLLENNKKNINLIPAKPWSEG